MLLLRSLQMVMVPCKVLKRVEVRVEVRIEVRVEVSVRFSCNEGHKWSLPQWRDVRQG